MTEINVEPLEKHFGRTLTDQELEIAKACGPGLQWLAVICIEENLSCRVADRVATMTRACIDLAGHTAAKLAADVVTMERLAPGSVTKDDKKRH